MRVSTRSVVSLAGTFLKGMSGSVDQAPEIQSFLDVPRANGPNPVRVESRFLASGWVLPPLHRKLQAVEFRIGESIVARARLRLPRPDVQQCYPDHPDAAWAGFDAELPLDRWLGRIVELVVMARMVERVEKLTSVKLDIASRKPGRNPRPRSYDLMAILSCPRCGKSPLSVRGAELYCRGCSTPFELRDGTPIFATPGEPATSRLDETNWTHPYSPDATNLIKGCQGMVLDFGAGNVAPEHRHPNIVFHEAIHYTSTDVVCNTPRLPYRDEAFDVVISQAVFEHLPRPWETAAELYRILKPGGRLHVDTAFMQPFHADPCHYFNMTLSGIREVFHAFRENDVGIKPYQSAAWGLRMQWDVLLAHLRPGAWRTRLQEMRAALDRDDLDLELDACGQQYLAAGVFFDGAKPLH